MKHLILFFVLLTSLVAQKLSIGAGPYIQSQPYKGADAKVLPSPVVFFDNDIVYIRWTRVGLYFLGDKNDDFSWGFSLTALPDPYGYKASDSSALRGMDEKKGTYEAGLAFSAKYDKAFMEIMALRDILNNNDSWLVKTTVGYKFDINKLSLYPSLNITYQDDKYLRYYYGVKASEATASRATYSPDAGVKISLQTYADYPLTKNISALINLKATKLSNEVTDSPIVDEDYIYSGMISLIYTFDF